MNILGRKIEMKPWSYHFFGNELTVIFENKVDQYISYKEGTKFPFDDYDITLLTVKNHHDGFIINYKSIPLTIKVLNKSFSISKGPDDIQTIHSMDEKDIDGICNEFLSITLEYMQPKDLVTWLTNIKKRGIEEGKRIVKERMDKLFD